MDVSVTNLIVMVNAAKDAKYRNLLAEFYGPIGHAGVATNTQVRLEYFRKKVEEQASSDERDHKDRQAELSRQTTPDSQEDEAKIRADNEAWEKRMLQELAEDERKIWVERRDFAKTPAGKKIYEIGRNFRELRKTPEGRDQVRKWLKENRDMWMNSPFSNDVKGMEMELDKSENSLK
jgi:hypothetical protein